MIVAACCLAWIFLLLFWGRFWRADQRLVPAAAVPNWPEIAIVIPARNEAETIGEVVASHKASDYPGRTHLIVVDDSSDDGTGAIATKSGADVVTAAPLPKGWSGKLWAVNSGLVRVDSVAPDAEYVLLTDADIVHAPDTLRRLVAMAIRENLALVSLMARLDARGLWGRLLIPAFVFFFQKLYPFPWVNAPNMPFAGAAGGCILVRRDALREIGGIAAMKQALIDDCTLAARIKHGPPRRRIWLGLADDEVISLRNNQCFNSIWIMVRRTAFTQLHQSWLLLTLAVLGMGFLYLTPLIGLVVGLVTGDVWTAVLALTAIAMMSLAYAPTIRLYRLPLGWVFTLPGAAVLYTAMTVASALAHLRGLGGAWKGRTYG
ncbi:MAG: glycosyltransferase [Pseudomonadota bacterium]